MAMGLSTQGNETPLPGILAARESMPHAAGSARKCVATGQLFVKASMIRFVVGPEGQIVPDLAGKLPGRGLWVAARRGALAQAAAKNPFTRAAKTRCKVDAAMPQMVEDLLRRRCLDLIGLTKSAGIIVFGLPQIEEALRKGKIACLLLTADAGRDVRKKLATRPVVVLEIPFLKSELGASLGRDCLVSIGLEAHPLVDKLRQDLARLSGVSLPKAPFEPSSDTINRDSEQP